MFQLSENQGLSTVWPPQAWTWGPTLYSLILFLTLNILNRNKVLPFLLHFPRIGTLCEHSCMFESMVKNQSPWPCLYLLLLGASVWLRIREPRASRQQCTGTPTLQLASQGGETWLSSSSRASLLLCTILFSLSAVAMQLFLGWESVYRPNSHAHFGPFPSYFAELWSSWTQKVELLTTHQLGKQNPI